MNKKVQEKEVVASEGKDMALPEEYFQGNKNVGLSSLTVEDIPMPGLTIIQSTSKIRDDEDRPYAPGKLYYKALKQAYSIVECSILVITKKEMPSYEDKSVLERTFVVLGCIEPGFMPFVLYAKSSAYFAVRKFIGEVKARKYPMYALKVQISTEKRQNDQGEWYMPVFNIVGVRTNPEEIVMLEELATEYDANNSKIRSEDEQVATTSNIYKDSPTAEDPVSTNPEDEVKPDDVPF